MSDRNRKKMMSRTANPSDSTIDRYTFLIGDSQENSGDSVIVSNIIPTLFEILKSDCNNV